MDTFFSWTRRIRQYPLQALGEGPLIVTQAVTSQEQTTLGWESYVLLVATLETVLLQDIISEACCPRMRFTVHPTSG